MTASQPRRRSWTKRGRALLTELKARRAGQKAVSNSIGRAARDVTGPTGWVWSDAWDKLDQHGDAYIKSFDRRLPPSIFVSERDRRRHGMPMPLVERCIEDYEPRIADVLNPERRPAGPGRPEARPEAPTTDQVPPGPRPD